MMKNLIIILGLLISTFTWGQENEPIKPSIKTDIYQESIIDYYPSPCMSLEYHHTSDGIRIEIIESICFLYDEVVIHDINKLINVFETADKIFNYCIKNRIDKGFERIIDTAYVRLTQSFFNIDDKIIDGQFKIKYFILKGNKYIKGVESFQVIALLLLEDKPIHYRQYKYLYDGRPRKNEVVCDKNTENFVDVLTIRKEEYENALVDYENKLVEYNKNEQKINLKLDDILSVGR